MLLLLLLAVTILLQRLPTSFPFLPPPLPLTSIPQLVLQQLAPQTHGRHACLGKGTTGLRTRQDSRHDIRKQRPMGRSILEPCPQHFPHGTPDAFVVIAGHSQGQLDEEQAQAAGGGAGEAGGGLAVVGGGIADEGEQGFLERMGWGWGGAT